MTPDPPRRRLAEPAFPDDTGAADPLLADALAAWSLDPTREVEVLAALRDARVLVAVVAVAGEVEEAPNGHGLVDKTADMAVVLITGSQGNLGLLAFTGLAAMAAWDPAARPAPVTAVTAASAALADGAVALVLDVAGPTTYAVAADDLNALAQGWRPARVGGAAGRTAWIRPGPE